MVSLSSLRQVLRNLVRSQPDCRPAPAGRELDQTGAPVLNVALPKPPCREPAAFRCTIGVLDGAFVSSFAEKLQPLGARLVSLSPQQGPVEAQMAGVDGLLIPGGADVHPSFYNEPVHGAMVSASGPGPTEAFKLACIRSAYAAATPMLGVCLGLQMMNVAAGGTLVQDIGSQWIGPHGERGSHPGRHSLTLVGDSALRDLVLTDRLQVNSMHHQGIKDLGRDLRITAVAHDGLPEAIQHVRHAQQMGVQFHPEVMENPLTDRLFAYLVDNAAAWRKLHLVAGAPGAQ